jgi:hypothetical protein
MPGLKVGAHASPSGSDQNCCKGVSQLNWITSRALKSLLTILFALASFTPVSAEFDPFEGPKPIAVFIQTDPWAMVIDSDTPNVAAYEDGSVIFWKKSGSNGNYRQKQLSVAEFSELKQQLAPVANLKDLKPFYSLRPFVTDQPEARFYIHEQERQVVTAVYGLRDVDTSSPAQNRVRDQSKPDVVPGELLKLHKFLCSIDYPNSDKWRPQFVEVMIWPYEYAPDVSITWPKNWPGLDSKRAIKRGDSYSIFLDGIMFPELQKFLKTRKEKGAVKIGDKKWAVSFRYVFPSEPMWRKAFEGSQAK